MLCCELFVNLLSLNKYEKYKGGIIIMARTKKKTERELIEEAQNLDESEVLSKLEDLKAQLANLQKRKADAKLKALQLAKDDVFNELLLLLDVKSKFDECESLADFDDFCDSVKSKIKFLCEFYELNQNCDDIVIPKVEEKRELKEKKEPEKKVEPEVKDESVEENHLEAKDEPESKEEE